MDISFTVKEKEFTFTVHIVPQDYQQKLAEQFRELGEKVSLKGFRKNTPAFFKILQQRYGKDILHDTILEMTSGKVKAYVKSHKINLLSDELDMNQTLLDQMKWIPGESFTLVLEGDLGPDFDGSIDSAMEVETYTITSVSEAAIDKQIDNLRKLYGYSRPVNTIEEANAVFGEIIYENGKKEPLELLIDSSVVKTANLEGKQRGDKVTWSCAEIAKLNCLGSPTIPKEGHVVAHILDICYITPAAMDQPLFDLVFGDNSVTDVQAFKAKTKERFIEANQNIVDSFLKKKIQNHILSPMDIPSSHRRYKKEDIDQLYWLFVVKKIASKYKIQVFPKEMNTFISDIQKYANFLFAMPSLDDGTKKVLDILKRALKNPKGTSYYYVVNYLLERKVMELIKSKIHVRYKDITVEEIPNLD